MPQALGDTSDKLNITSVWVRAMVDATPDVREAFKNVAESIVDENSYNAALQLRESDPLSGAARAGATFSFVAGGDDGAS
eukprot:692101-Pyramimonas_sp.AAC.1